MKLFKLLCVFLNLLICNQVCAQEGFERYPNVLPLGQKPPEGGRLLGTVEQGDGLRNGCGFHVTLLDLKAKGLEMGGNVLLLTQVKTGGISNCYRMVGNVYLVDEREAFWKKRLESVDSVINPKFPDSATYAVLYLYRPFAAEAAGATKPYNVYVNDEKVWRAKNGCFKKLILYNPTTVTISTGSREQYTKELTLEKGKAYYIHFLPYRTYQRVPATKGVRVCYWLKQTTEDADNEMED
jgi:hypothetical protein